MKEDLLQYVWRFQQLNRAPLYTTTGESVVVFAPGQQNSDAGPDFSRAHIAIGDIELHGHIEVHIKGSDWRAHGHDQDRAYEGVILHVVWEDDESVFVQGKPLPTLVISNWVDEAFLERYRVLMGEQTDILCLSHLADVPLTIWQGMTKRALLQRLNDKYHTIYDLLKKNKDDSELTTYQLLARNFGFKVNGDTFFRLSELVPLKVIQRNIQDLPTLEALLFGQAGFLEEVSSKSKYIKGLVAAHQHLKSKYKLPPPLTKSQWKFFRLRPANFPTIRIAQFARLLYNQTSIFYLLINSSYQELHKKLHVSSSLYWRKHYLIGKKSKKTTPLLGKSSIDNIVINTVVPLLIAYGRLRDNDFYVNKAIDLLKKLPPEDNKTTKEWKRACLPIKNAFDSQGSIALKRLFCQPKQCLSCDIGTHILKH